MKTIGFDVGTGNLVVAYLDENNNISTRSMRNAYYLMEPEMLDTSMFSPERNDYVEIKTDDGDTDKVALIGKDAYDLCNAVNKTVKRPMKKGVMSSSDFESLDVITAMIGKLIGGPVNSGYCVYSVPAQAVDIDIPPVLWHESISGKIFETYGYTAKSMNEGMGVIFSECAKENFSGIGISFGSGLSNIALAINGIPVITFSVSRGGDWIDESVANSLGLKPNKVTVVKEKDDFNLINPTATGKKTEKRIREAIAVYYKNLINYILKVFIEKFEESSDGVDLEREIPIIISGGTSKANGFLQLFKEIFEKNEDEFPFEISEIRHAENPLDAVARGNLIYAIWEQRKLNKQNDKSSSDETQKDNKDGKDKKK